MNNGKDTADTRTAEVEEHSRPFCPEIKGDLRRRLFKYAREKGRSATNAALWSIGQFLKTEGY